MRDDVTPRITPRRSCARALFCAAALHIVLLATSAHGQSLARTPLLEPPDVGMPWNLELRPEFRFARSADAGGVRLRTTFDLAMGLPAWLQAGVSYTPQSPVVAGRPDEWEVRARWAPVAEPRGPVDVTVRAGWNGAASSADAEVALARWFGPLRLLGAGRLLSDAWGLGQTRGGVAAGVLLHPRPRHMPIALSADAGTLLGGDAATNERVAWSVALHVGVSFTTHTLAVFATNTASGTLHGSMQGDTRTRLGIGFTAPIAAGRLLGHVASREAARRSVTGEVAAGDAMVAADILRYAYPQYRLVVQRGTTIEWTNRDDVVHTVSGDDGTWGSGAIRPGERWRARFDEPGIYPYHCAPHPFMKGSVIVL